MFFIGLAAGAIVMFILMVIYSSLAVAGRADRAMRSEDWDYEQEEIRPKRMARGLQPAFMEAGEDMMSDLDQRHIEAQKARDERNLSQLDNQGEDKKISNPQDHKID